MDLRKIKKLIELLEDSTLAELEISEGDNTIRLSRNGTIGVAQALPGSHTNVSMSVPPVVPVGSEPAPGEVTTESASGNQIESPMVGTYYDSPSPDAPPFVKVGSKVKRGDTLCVIEAMKTFNQIEAESDGIIKAIHKNNGDPVEYGESLFTIS